MTTGAGMDPEAVGELNGGTASDHYALGWAHLKHAIKLTFCAGGAKGSSARAAEPPPTPQADDVNDGEPNLRGVFLPTHAWKEIWDLYVLVLILYSAVTVPYRICFNAGAQGSVFIFEQMLTMSFIVDVCFNFNTAYMADGEKWIVDRGLIAQKYISGWFWIDAPSSVPVEMIDLLMEGDSSQLGMLRFLRLFRLLRLLRLLKVRDGGLRSESSVGCGALRMLALA